MSTLGKRNKIVIAAIVLIVVIAIGAGFYTTQQPTTTTTTAVTTETTQAGRPVPNPDTLVEETARETGSYDIAMAWDAGANYVLENVYETLVTFDGSRADKFIPWLAESWDVSPDGLVYTFHLRRGIKFQDGTPFNATAVKYSLDRTILINAPDGPQFLIAPTETMAIKGAPRYYGAETTLNYNPSEAKIYLAQEGVKVLDDYTVQITLEHPYAAAIATMAFASFGIISPSYVIKNCPGSPEMPGVMPGTTCEFMLLHALGTGPFKAVEITPKSRVVLERFDEYWGGPEGLGPAKLKRYIIKYVPEIGTRELDLFAGTADAIELPATNAYDLIDKDAWLTTKTIKPIKPGIRVWTARTLQVVDFYANPRFPPFDNILFRQAVAYAFPYDKYIEQVLNGFATRRAGEIPEGMLGYDPTIQGYDYNPEKARELLQQVGYEGSIELIVSTGDTMSLTACLLIKDSLRELAPQINVEIREVDQATWYTLYHEFKVAARVGKWYQDIADPSVMIANFATQAGFRGLFTQFENETINNLVNEAAATLDESKRVELYREIQLEMLRKLPYIPLCTPIALQAERDWVLPADSPVGRGVYNPEYGDGDGGLSGGYHAYYVWKTETTPQVEIYIGNSPLTLIQNNSYLIAPTSPTAVHRYS